MEKITNFSKAKLKKTEVHEKNTLPTKETIEQEQRSEISWKPRKISPPNPLVMRKKGHLQAAP
ncbi:thymosin beta-10-like [Apodemus sylvaticus]|uniref:thymosin beta-10-like n=1 Tax=Apodemus sylvaticus TaxID=10129 RepID=UPI002244CA0D|nr:thymosin beta-10-like [Apodemus sylvaticus]